MRVNLLHIKFVALPDISCVAPPPPAPNGKWFIQFIPAPVPLCPRPQKDYLSNWELHNVICYTILYDIGLTYRYFTTKYLSHRRTCYLRAKFLPYKARFEYQKWVHF